jgi:hypothetical protein
MLSFLKNITFITFLILCIQSYQHVYSQERNGPAGGRSAGISNASVTLKDEWSSFNNQAGLAFIEKPIVGLYFENKYQVKEFSMQAGTFALPLKPATLSLSYRFFGYTKYNDTKIGLGIGRKFTDHFSAGIQINYMQNFFAEGYGTYNALTAEIGLLAEPLQNLNIGFHVFNPTLAKNDASENEVLPTIIRCGISYTIESKASLYLEAEKQLEIKPLFRAGLEITPIENLYFRLGFSTLIEQYSVGIGYKLKKIKADIAFSNNAVLGFSPKASLAYEF